MSNCKLCLKDKPLRNSHIIPEFLYKHLYNTGHILTEISSEPNRKRWPPLQKGIREPMLCQCCEVRLSRFETYAARFWGDGAGASFKWDGRVLDVSGIDYVKFKLFQMSILWRAGEASDPFFKHVSLEPEHSEELRNMLLTEAAGEPKTYGCVFVLLRTDLVPGGAVDYMPMPERIPFRGQTGHRFVMGSTLWVFLIGRVPEVKFPLGGILEKGGTMRLHVIRVEDRGLPGW